MRTSRKTRSNADPNDFDGMKYSPELIRSLEDPNYAKAADAYERKAKRDKYKEANQNKRGKRSKRNKKQKRYRFNKWRLIKNILILIAFLIIVGLIAFFLLTRSFDKVDTSNADFGISDTVADNLSGYRNIAILGVDARADEGYDGSRTDAIIIMSIKKSTGDVRLISVMRDSYLKMSYSDGSMILDKINHANHWVDAVNTCAALNRSLDLNIKEFVLFDWKAVADMVDCFGGVELDVKDTEISDMNTWGPETATNVGGTYNQITTSGKQTLNGSQAVTYCRIRKTSGGDAGRGSRYKQVLTAVMKKAITHPTKLAQLSNTVFPGIRTNMSQLQMLTLGMGFVRYDIGDSISWPYDYYSGYLSDGISYVVPTTLSDNVTKLHQEAFGQTQYQLSEICSQINDDIIYDTGLQ